MRQPLVFGGLFRVGDIVWWSPEPGPWWTCRVVQAPPRLLLYCRDGGAGYRMYPVMIEVPVAAQQYLGLSTALVAVPNNQLRHAREGVSDTELLVQWSLVQHPGLIPHEPRQYSVREGALWPT